MDAGAAATIAEAAAEVTIVDTREIITVLELINGYFLHKRLPKNSVIFRVDAYVKITGNHLYF